MQHQVTDKQLWAEVETNHGTEFVPLEQLGLTLPEWPDNDDEAAYNLACYELLQDYLSGSQVYHAEQFEGYGARLSMPGYTDCTEWVVYSTKQQAIDYLKDTYE